MGAGRTLRTRRTLARLRGHTLFPIPAAAGGVPRRLARSPTGRAPQLRRRLPFRRLSRRPPGAGLAGPPRRSTARRRRRSRGRSPRIPVRRTLRRLAHGQRRRCAVAAVRLRLARLPRRRAPHRHRAGPRRGRGAAVRPRVHRAAAFRPLECDAYAPPDHSPAPRAALQRRNVLVEQPGRGHRRNPHSRSRT